MIQDNVFFSRFKISNLDLKSITAKSTVDIITTGISVVMFAIMTVLKWFLAFSSRILIVSFVVFLISFLIKLTVKNPKVRKYAHHVFVFSCVMAVCSFFGQRILNCRQKSNDANVTLCDYTDTVISHLVADIPWITYERVQDDIIRFYSGSWSNNDTDTFLKKYIDRSFARTQTDEDFADVPFEPLWFDTSPASRLIVFDTEWALPGFEEALPKRLPFNVNLTLAGLKLLRKDKWNDALGPLKEAFNQGNGVAGYYLYFIYANGLGCEKDSDLAISYLRQSADLGSREAKLEYGEQLLKKGGEIDVALGLQCLKGAALLSEFRSPSCIVIMQRAIDILQDYYYKTEQFKQAYSFSKELTKKNGLADLQYYTHLDNCLLTGHYDEAKEIIEKGIKSKNYQEAGYCKVIQAKMLSQGLGVKKDLRKAELALRFASDSLDYPFARKKLAEFYAQEGYKEESDFWQRLYDIHFRNTIND